jgi:hypothetical protein
MIAHPAQMVSFVIVHQTETHTVSATSFFTSILQLRLTSSTSSSAIGLCALKSMNAERKVMLEALMPVTVGLAMACLTLLSLAILPSTKRCGLRKSIARWAWTGSVSQFSGATHDNDDLNSPLLDFQAEPGTHVC